DPRRTRRLSVGGVVGAEGGAVPQPVPDLGRRPRDDGGRLVALARYGGARPGREPAGGALPRGALRGARLRSGARVPAALRVPRAPVRRCDAAVPRGSDEGRPVPREQGAVAAADAGPARLARA